MTPRATRTVEIPVADGQREYLVPDAERVLSVTWVLPRRQGQGGGRYTFEPVAHLGQGVGRRYVARTHPAAFTISIAPGSSSVLLGTYLEVEVELATEAPRPPELEPPPAPKPAAAEPPRLRQPDLFG